MKKGTKVIFYGLILITIITPFFMIIKADADENDLDSAEDETAEKGDLRCPLVINDPSVKCKEYKDNNGKVTKVELTYGSINNPGDIEMVKTVSKKSQIGRFDVSFKVRANNVTQIAEPTPVDVVLIIDTSRTISDNFENVKTAVKREFLNNVGSNVNVAILQFANEVHVTKNFKTDNKEFKKSSICGFKQCGLGTQSFVGKALKKAREMLAKRTGNRNKYIILFGDGQYWSENDTGAWKDVITERDKLRDAGVKIYSVRFDGSMVYRDKNGKVTKDYGYYCQDVRDMLLLASGEDGKPNTHSDYAKEIKKRCVGNGRNHNTIDKYSDRDAYLKMLETVDDKEKYYMEVIGKDFTNLFFELAGAMNDGNPNTYQASLVDEIGDDFFLSNADGKYQSFHVGEFKKEYVELGTFEIYIDPYAEKGWQHKTNERFTLTYKDQSGNPHEIIVSDNPEVYWEPNVLNINSCSGTARADTLTGLNISDEYSYYTKKCVEGEGENGAIEKGFEVKAVVNNLPLNTKSFTLKKGEGFTFNVNMKSVLTCTYTFNTTAYNSKYNSLTTNIQNLEKELEAKLIEEATPPPQEPEPEPETPAESETPDESENQENPDNPEEENPNSLSEDIPEVIEPVVPVRTSDDIRRDIINNQIELDNLKKVVEQYRSILEENDIDDYIKRFEDQDAVVLVNYSSNTSNKQLLHDEIYLENTDVQTSKNCKESGNVTPNGADKPIASNKVCTVKLEKSMELESGCINMRTGDQEECSEAEAQLDGGRQIYPSYIGDEGEVTLQVSSAGYRGNFDFSLKSTNEEDGCKFKVNNERDNKFRQIKLDDPFLKTYDPNREVGENYSNSKFDFQEIIHGDTWASDKEAEYDFYLSKTNIQNIRKDTAEDRGNSYLGRYCYFTEDNKYVCQFPRNETIDGSDNGDYWFTPK